jgi:hypothetical protein
MKNKCAAIILAIAGCVSSEAFGASVNPAAWNFSLTSYGSNVYYNPTLPVLDNTYLVYNYHVEITKIEVLVFFVWIDVTQTVGGPFVNSGQDPDGLPAIVLSNTYGSSSYGVSVDVLVWAAEDGYGHATITNVSLGITSGIRASGTATVQGISKPYLATQVAGGKGTISPASGEQSFKQVVEMTVTPEYGYGILRWDGSDNNTLKTRNAAVTMNGNRTVTAVLEPYLPGDLSDEGIVDMEDFALFGRQWMLGGCTDPAWCDGADINQDGSVLTADAILLADNWLWDDTLGASGYWRLDEGVGGIARDRKGLHDGILMNMDAISWSYGAQGMCLAFDGSNDYVEISSYKGITGTASRTCSAWIKTSGSTSNMVIMDWGTAVSGQKWLFGIFATGQLALYTWTPYIQTNITVTDNQWHHVAAVLTNDGTPDVSEIKLYVDGLLQATTVSSSQAINTVSAANVLLGACDYAGTKGFYFKGLIDEVGIYNRAMTDTEITLLAE